MMPHARQIHSSVWKLFLLALALVFAGGGMFVRSARGEAMLQLFNVNWDELVTKMPEIAEAGYTSLWLPPPAKAGSVYSVGYDHFDPFDLGDKNQRGTVRTRYGTKAQLLQAVEMAHRFGLRVYFDNIMNHRAFDVPGYNANTPTNLYPGLSPGDFHLRKQADGTYRNWDNINNWNDVWQVQHRPLFGLIDLANEPGSNNENFGATEGSTAAKPYFIRQPNNREYYMVTNQPAIAGAWRPFNGTNGVPVPEDVNAYLIRAAMWTMNETKCDGFRFDAVKHVPASFFGSTTANADGYTGGIQTIFDAVHGYGNNATGNGYVEGDDNRNSCYDSEAPRNDALLFGEHLGEPPSYAEYLNRGMRLLNSPYHFQLNNILGQPGASLSGLDQRDYRPYGSAFTGPQSILFVQSHDDGFASRRELQVAYNAFREGIPAIYSDGYNQSSGPDYFPRVASAPYLGEYGDRKMPDAAYLHHQLARGGTRSRWSDSDIVAFERYDYREVATDPYNNPDATVVLFAMNDNYGNPGDISFDDGAAQNDSGMPSTCYPVVNSRNIGLVVGFAPGTWLSQLADSPGRDRACSKLLVRYATASLAEAQSTANDANPVNRKVFVGGQTVAPGGGAIEFKIPSGGYVAYGEQWPEASRASLKDAITFQQGGAEVARLTTYRHDGVNGDTGFNPNYPFKMRGSVDAGGNVIGGANVSNRTYAIDIPVVTNANFDILIRSDASTVNTLAKLDSGLDLNSQMGLGFSGGFEKRDNRPGAASDVFVGYEQTTLQFRDGPEKFVAVVTNRNNVTSAGAETYWYTVGGTNNIVNGSGNGANITTLTAAWAHHDPAATNTAATNGTATQLVPLNPNSGASADIWVKVGYNFYTNVCYIYYTTDGSNPEGSFGVGKGTTKVLQAAWIAHDSADAMADWFKGTIPETVNTEGTQVRYKIGFHIPNIATISDTDSAKRYGLTQFAITNFNPTNVTVWLHGDRNTNNTVTGLQPGFHILRARTFLPRSGKASVYNTFLQTFYYDPALPTGVIAFPVNNGETINSTTYGVVVRADSSVSDVEFNIQDSDGFNDDTFTGQNNGNGSTNGASKFARATAVAPNAVISAQYPNYPQEFRFDYVAIPNSGAATITVRLKTPAASVLTNRFTTLIRTVTTAAPATPPPVVRIANPATNGLIYVVNTNEFFPLQVCFTSTLTTNDASRFSIFLNGVFQSRGGFVFDTNGCGTGMRSLYCNLTNLAADWNFIEVIYTNAVTLSATRTMLVARPGDSDGDDVIDVNELYSGTDPYDPDSVLRITALDNNSQLVVWDSVPGYRYLVQATTNLNEPMQPVSQTIQASGPSSFYYDSTTNAVNKFYRIKVAP